MRSKYLFVIAALLLVSGVSVLFSSFHGQLSINGVIPTAGSSLEVNGAAKGGWALASLLMIAAGFVVYGVAIVRAFAIESEVKPVGKPVELSK